MKMFMGPVDLAGQGEHLAEGLRKHGLSVKHLIYNRNYLQQNQNVDYIDLKHLSTWFYHHWEKFDCFCFWWNQTFTDDYSDLPLLKAANKKLFMRHCGGDLRLESLGKKKNPYLNVIHPRRKTEEQIIDQLKHLSTYIDHAIVPDYELYEPASLFYKYVHVIPWSFPVENYLPHYPIPKKPVPLIIHAPTNKKAKGSDYIQATINQLKKVYRFDYRIIEGLTNQEALHLYKKADIIIDQILIGTHGVFAIEAMALGKPVVCYIREDLQKKFPQDLPIVSANPDNLYQKLDGLLKNGYYRYRLGRLGRRYAEKVHSPDVVARQFNNLIKRYQ